MESGMIVLEEGGSSPHCTGNPLKLKLAHLNRLHYLCAFNIFAKDGILEDTASPSMEGE